MQTYIIYNNMNNPDPIKISIADLQKQIGTLTRAVGYEKQHFILTNHGYELGAILPYAEYQELMKMRNAQKIGEH